LIDTKLLKIAQTDMTLRVKIEDFQLVRVKT